MTYYFKLHNQKSNKISIRKAKAQSRTLALKALIKQFMNAGRKIERYTVLEASSVPIEKTLWK